MDGGTRFVGRIVEVEHDLADQDVSDALLCSSVRAWRIPGRRQVSGERQQCDTIDLRAERRGGIVPGDPILDMLL
jgi:hypothetical protein